MFNLILFIQLRGRENLRNLKKDTFAIATNEGKKYMYVYIKTTLLSKNVKASLSSKEFRDMKKAKMYESENNCHVQKFMKYLSLLTSSTTENTLFPLITKNGKISSNALVGKDKLGNLMSRLSKVCQLSRKYTNHCIRVAGINMLHDGGFSDSTIATITGHKNSASVQRYHRSSESSVYNASNILSAGRKRKKNIQKDCEEDIFPPFEGISEERASPAINSNNCINDSTRSRNLINVEITGVKTPELQSFRSRQCNKHPTNEYLHEMTIKN